MWRCCKKNGMTTFKEIKHNLKQDVSKLPVIKVVLLGDTATQLLATTLNGVGVEYGYNMDLYEAEYNQVERQVEDPASELYQIGAKSIVVFQSTHKLCEVHSQMSADKQNVLADNRIGFVRMLCEQNKSAKVIYFNYPEIGANMFSKELVGQVKWLLNN